MTTMANVTTGDVIRAADHNSIVDFLKGVAGTGEGMLLVYNAAGVLTLTPSTNPAASTELIIVNNAAGTRQFAITAGGDLVGTGGILTLPAGADTLVGLATTDVLTNKTLTSPTIANFTNAAHDHGDADDGGSLVASITLTTPTIADFTNAQHDHTAADEGGVVSVGDKVLVSRYIHNATNSVTAASGYTDFGGSFTVEITTLTGDQVHIVVQGNLRKDTGGNAGVVIDRDGTKLPSTPPTSVQQASTDTSNPYCLEFWDTPAADTYIYKPQVWSDDASTARAGLGFPVQYLVEVWR